MKKIKLTKADREHNAKVLADWEVEHARIRAAATEPEQLGDMGEVWQRNLDVVLNRDLPAATRLEALHAIDRLFDGPLTPVEDLESVCCELEDNIDSRR